MVRVALADLDHPKDRVDHHYLEDHEHQDSQADPVFLLPLLVRLVLVDPWKYKFIKYIRFIIKEYQFSIVTTVMTGCFAS